MQCLRVAAKQLVVLVVVVAGAAAPRLKLEAILGLGAIVID